MAITERAKGHIYVFTANAMFGVFIPISKYLLKDCVSPLMLTFLRFAGATLLFWCVSFLIKDARVTKKDLGWFLIFTLTGIVFNQGLFMFALNLTSPIDTSVIVTALPFATLIISALFFKDPITRRKILGISTGAAGAIWLMLSSAGGNSFGSGSILGDFIVLLTTFSSSFYIVLSKPLTLKYSPITISKWMFLFSTIIFLPLSPKVFDTSQSIKADLGFWDIAGILYVVCGATFCTYLLLNMGIKRIRPTTVAMYNYVQPVVSSVVAILACQDVFSWNKLFAAIIVFLGVYIVTTSPRTKEQLAVAKLVEERAAKTGK